MNFSCDNCQRRYSIADEKVRGKTVRIRCKNCQNVITLTGPAHEPDPEFEVPEEDRTRMVPLTEIEKIRATSLVDIPAAPPPAPKDPWEDEPTRTAPPLDTSAQWFAMVKGQQVGPLDATGLSQRMGMGEINVRTYLWKQGMADWKRAADLPELATLLAGAQPSSAPPVAEFPRAAPRTWKEPEPEVRAPVAARQPEPRQPEPQEPEPSPEQGSAPFDSTLEEEPPTSRSLPGGSGVGAADLFSDLDLDHRGEDPGAAAGHGSLEEGFAPPGMARPRAGRKQDPFAAVGGGDPSGVPPQSESTNYFIAKSGVNRRNPPWKIASFFILLIALPVGVLYLLSELKVVPLEVTRVNSAGQPVKESVFSAEGVSGLRDLLLGRKQEAARAPASPAAERARPASGQVRGEKDKPAPKSPDGPSAEELKQLYAGNPDKREVAPTVRKNEEVAARDSAGDGPAQREVAKVLAQTQPAFQNCIEQELRQHPDFKGGKINIVATVASSGTVKKAQIDRRDIDSSKLGECLKTRARHMTFSAFSGDDVDLEIPLILTKAM